MPLTFRQKSISQTSLQTFFTKMSRNALYGNHVRLFVRLWSSISGQTACQIFMKFGTMVYFKESPKKQIFCKNWLIACRSSQDPKISSPLRSTFLDSSGWDELQQLLLSNSECRQYTESHTLHSDVNFVRIFYIYRPTWIKFVIRNAHENANVERL
jgi:hypothetical protein